MGKLIRVPRDVRFVVGKVRDLGAAIKLGEVDGWWFQVFGLFSTTLGMIAQLTGMILEWLRTTKVTRDDESPRPVHLRKPMAA